MVREIRTVLKKHFEGIPHWGFKEPSTTVLMPLYREAFSAEGVVAARYPIMVRHPLSVVSSNVRGRRPLAIRLSWLSQTDTRSRWASGRWEYGFSNAFCSERDSGSAPVAYLL